MRTSRRIIATAQLNTHRNSYEKEFQCTTIGIEKESDVTSMYKTVSDLIMYTKPDVFLVQMSAKKGIAKHGMRAIQSVLKEFTEFDGKEVVAPLDPDTLSHEEKKKYLITINLIIEKRDGRLKARTRADGYKQRPYITKERSSSPMVSTEALSITLTIDAQENREVATYDVAGVYLNTDMDDFTTLKLEGHTVDLMIQVDPEKL